MTITSTSTILNATVITGLKWLYQIMNELITFSLKYFKPSITSIMNIMKNNSNYSNFTTIYVWSNFEI